MTLRNIKSRERFELEESQTVYSDSDVYGGNKVFRIKIRPLDNLAGGKGSKRGPNDPSEDPGEYQVGDTVRGVGEEDHEDHMGQVVKIDFDEDNTEEVLSLTIEEDGRLVKLVPGTVVMVQDKGGANQPGGGSEIEGPDTNLATLTQYTFEGRVRGFDEFEG
jgi:hypothetical protein